MIHISIVVDKAIAAGSSEDVGIGTSLPLESVRGTVSVLDDSVGVHLPPGDYTASLVDESTVNIAVASGATDLADGDIVNLVAIGKGDIARP